MEVTEIVSIILTLGLGGVFTWAYNISGSHNKLSSKVDVLEDRLKNNSKSDDDRNQSIKNFEEKIWTAIEKLNESINVLNLKVERLSEKLGK